MPALTDRSSESTSGILHTGQWERRLCCRLRMCVLSCLGVRVHMAPLMQVYFLGADTTINYQPSSTWLAEQARYWPWRSHLLMNAPRSEALSVLSMEGMMVVFCSLVENMPYVVAEVLLLPVWHICAEQCISNPYPRIHPPSALALSRCRHSTANSVIDFIKSLTAA